uniref:Phenylalanine--tRNA ligase beta subunit, chloroplastic n=1 Tax=Triparma laevis TaxID=1534972 RepID=A0A0K2RWA6_9STRA|nr:phenylalanyl tRNA synthetase beta subunit [Triparma laevis]BAS19099.1 phenylalanyl tRNA synthetase beta subunit [Triparma laevis]
MRVPLSWVTELIDIQDINLDMLVDKLTLAGFEVEEILVETINQKSEIILDLSATANRPDSLSMNGISKEIGAILNKPLNPIKTGDIITRLGISKIKNKQSTINFENCSEFLTVKIRNLTNLVIPGWITQKLLCCDVTPQKNIQDLINYVLLETGYPFQLYDLDKITSALKNDNFQFSINRIPKNDVVSLTVNEVKTEYKIKTEILGLYANNLLIGLPGISEEFNTTPTNQTQNFLIEGSIYNSKYIRQASRKIGLRTERSARYEKGINNSNFLSAFSRLLALIELSNNDIGISCCSTFLSEEIKPNKVILTLNSIYEILGPIKHSTVNLKYLSIEQIENYLTRLGFELKPNNNQTWEVSVPAIRKDDITQEIDLIEEIGRLHGFNNFITKLPAIEKIGLEDFSYKFRKKLTACFLHEGFNELLNYSLVKNNNQTEIILNNPLISDCSVLRTSLLPNLIKNYSENINQGNVEFEGFEYGHIFELGLSNSYNEFEFVSGLFGNLEQKTNWNKPLTTLSWFEAKGKIETIFNRLHLKTSWVSELDSRYIETLHPFKSATIYIKNTNFKIGVFGQINSIIAKKKGITSNLYLFELNFEILKQIELEPTLTLYSEYSLYPKIIKDISFIINNKINFIDIKNYIYSINNELLINIELLDQYRGETIPLNHSSLCLKLTFQSKFKTLETNDIDKVLNEIEKGLKIKFATQMRG